MGAYEDELEGLQEELGNGLISISEYNKQLKEIEKEASGEYDDPWDWER